ncbi:hypothetical protein [Streptacidiphilus sp. EB103A]|uniref:hypothetical protein n=1 Tax=Streptacidiphilus sp. EB103A TaxID=3156275 RepID=UPI003514D9C8
MAVDLNFFRSQTSQRIREEGRAEGFRRGIALSVLRLLDNRDVHLSEEARQRVLGCGDQELLLLWVERALTASDETELFEG